MSPIKKTLVTCPFRFVLALSEGLRRGGLTVTKEIREPAIVGAILRFKNCHEPSGFGFRLLSQRGTACRGSLLPKTVESAKFNFMRADIWRMPV